jgi:hypothetical protein
VTPAEPTAETIERQFPQRHARKGVNGLWYVAVRRSSPQILVRGEDPVDLRNSIRRWLRNH